MTARSGPRLRRAAIYVAVMMTSLIVASMAVTALTIARNYTQRLQEEADFRQAQTAADAALEWAIASINANSDWRQNHVHNVDTSAVQLGTATLRYRILDEDGDLSDDYSDDCSIVVTAEVGQAVYSWTALLEAAGPALNCLAYSIAAKDQIDLELAACWAADNGVACDKSISVKAASLAADCFTTGNATGRIYGSITPLSQPLEFPSNSIFEKTASTGTSIDINSLPSSLGFRILDKQLLSPNQNTISGATNPNGIYVIDCNNQNISISNSRLHCTLVLLNAGSQSSVSQSVYWQAAQANMPALLVEGKFDLAITRTPLNESDVGINLNPPGTPYRGQSDTELTTIFPSQIRGTIYTNGGISLNNLFAQNDIVGCLMSRGRIYGFGDLFLQYRNIYSQNPPSIFKSFSSVRVQPGSLRREQTLP